MVLGRKIIKVYLGMTEFERKRATTTKATKKMEKRNKMGREKSFEMEIKFSGRDFSKGWNETMNQKKKKKR